VAGLVINRIVWGATKLPLKGSLAKVCIMSTLSKYEYIPMREAAPCKGP
jgi:hypothetical protein